jgi:hypothetical protein
MSESLTIYNAKPLTAVEIKAQVQVIQEVMAAVMVRDVHYGTIPGTPKPTLYKPGSEKILATFHIAAYPKEVEDLSTDDEIRYRVKVHGLTINGDIIGVGVGECSSNEEKYKWRAPVCDEEFNETPENRRREKWKKGYDGKPNYQLKQVRTNPADVANTILKMAKKRAQIDMTLTATAASDVFDQDLEDIPDEIRDGMHGQNGDQKGNQQSKSSTVKPGNSAGQDKKEGDKKTVRDTLRDELTAYCDGNTGRMQDLLKELTVFEIDKDGQKENVWRRLSGITDQKTKEAWVGKTLGKLREYVKAHPKEDQPDTSWCQGHYAEPECEYATFRGEEIFCEKQEKACDKPLSL